MYEPEGRYCKVCGRYREEKDFIGASCICQECGSLSPDEQEEKSLLNHLMGLPQELTRYQRDWLAGLCDDPRKKVREMADWQYRVRFAPETLSFIDEDGNAGVEGLFFFEDEVDEFDELPFC